MNVKYPLILPSYDRLNGIENARTHRGYTDVRSRCLHHTYGRAEAFELAKGRGVKSRQIELYHETGKPPGAIDIFGQPTSSRAS